MCHPYIEFLSNIKLCQIDSQSKTVKPILVLHIKIIPSLSNVLDIVNGFLLITSQLAVS